VTAAYLTPEEFEAIFNEDLAAHTATIERLKEDATRFRVDVLWQDAEGDEVHFFATRMGAVRFAHAMTRLDAPLLLVVLSDRREPNRPQFLRKGEVLR
jgi:hypothetical protein